jgi:hypothetical protein
MPEMHQSVWRCQLCGEACGPMWSTDPAPTIDPEQVILRCVACAATEAAEQITKEAADAA